jgi:NAD(P)H-dependent flavin oxidoreductase YrpB (nitropropane dioxygenase family)
MSLQSLHIGDLTIKYPIIQGGMGVGVSRCRLAGAVAKAGGLGIISTAQIGYDEPDFDRHPIETNLLAIKKHIRLAKEISVGGGGAVGVNIMVATKEYDRYVKAACEAGTDVIISGAGLPVTLPAITKDYPDVKLAPIVSSKKAANVILKMWDKKHSRTADFLVIEGPKAGGHMGFSREQLDTFAEASYDGEITAIIEVVKDYEKKYDRTIPVIVAGGIFDHQDILHALSLGASGVQIATPFVVTEECDASPAYKQAYLNATTSDVRIVQSPVGMPGRAIQNPFLDKVKAGRQPIQKCFHCLEKCDPATTPYCITKALIHAVQGDLDNGLIFCGADVDRLHEMTTVEELMKRLIGD